jgi:hypothetical protein
MVLNGSARDRMENSLADAPDTELASASHANQTLADIYDIPGDDQPPDVVLSTMPDAQTANSLIDFVATSAAAASSDESTAAQGSSFSTSTVKTIKLLQDKFGSPADQAARLEGVKFGDVSSGATRSAAVKFFFELLVLKTKDMIDLEQPSAWAEIVVRPTVSVDAFDFN